jgi:hypothetical protein
MNSSCIAFATLMLSAGKIGSGMALMQTLAPSKIRVAWETVMPLWPSAKGAPSSL